MSQQIDHIVDGVTQIADHVVKFQDRLTKRVDDLERKTEVSMADTLSRIERTRSSTLPPGAFGPVEGTSHVKSALTGEQLATVSEYVLEAKSFPEDSPLRDPAVTLATGEWFKQATLLQFQRGYQSEQFVKLDAALHDLGVSKAALAEDVDGTGGYLVPTIVGNEVIRLVYDAGDVFPRCRQMAMRAKTHTIPSESTAVTVNWIEEGNTLTGGEPVFSQKTLTAEKLAGRATMSVEVVQDSAPGLLQYLLEVFSEKMAGELDYQLILGDGSGPQITGVMSASGTNAITSATAAGRALTYNLLVEGFVAGGEKSTRRDGIWVVSMKGYQELLELVDGNSRPLLNYDVPNAPAGTVLGRPVVVSNRLGGSATLDDTTNSNTTICFGPPRAILAGTRQAMSWDVTDAVGWDKYQADCRLIGRFAGVVGVPSAWTYISHVTYG